MPHESINSGAVDSAVINLVTNALLSGAAADKTATSAIATDKKRVENTTQEHKTAKILSKPEPLVSTWQSLVFQVTYYSGENGFRTCWRDPQPSVRGEVGKSAF